VLDHDHSGSYVDFEVMCSGMWNVVDCKFFVEEWETINSLTKEFTALPIAMGIGLA